MLIPFFFKLREAGVPVSITEFLTLLEALEAQLAQSSAEDFYFLSRACMVKDERHFDRFDRAFAAHFKGAEELFEAMLARIPEEWLQKMAEKTLTEEEKAKIEALGGWDKLIETLKKRLEEQQKRHQGGNKWIGTAGTSPFGAYGYNPEGIRIGQDESRNRRAVKVWDRREFRNLDDQIELGSQVPARDAEQLVVDVRDDSHLVALGEPVHGRICLAERHPAFDAVGQELGPGGLHLPAHLARHLDDRAPQHLGVELV